MGVSLTMDGRVALVTGGASGIGEAVCRVFASAGAAVCIADLNLEAAQRLADELPQARAFECDVTCAVSIEEMFSAIPRLDALVNNAGIGLVGSIEETSPEDFLRLYRVNVEGVYLVTRAAISRLIESHGSVVNISSVAGLIGIRRRFAYCATKGAVVAMTKQLAVDYPTGFRVNCIAPGTVDTPFVEGYLERYHKHEKEKVRAELNARQPIGRLGKPEEIAHLALYMCSEQAAFMNGSVVTIDGGWTAA
jgi:NAD(P)-dependent dehydrogenase (short-subunit alcohol dehydrogenase family)